MKLSAVASQAKLVIDDSRKQKGGKGKAKLFSKLADSLAQSCPHLIELPSCSPSLALLSHNAAHPTGP